MIRSLAKAEKAVEPQESLQRFVEERSAIERDRPLAKRGQGVAEFENLQMPGERGNLQVRHLEDFRLRPGKTVALMPHQIGEKLADIFSQGEARLRYCDEET